MPSRDAVRLAEQTGCLPTEAQAALDAEPNAKVAQMALKAVMEYRRELFGPAVEAVWQQLVGSDSTSNELGLDQTIEFVQQLGLAVEDPLVLAVCYELQAPRVGVFYKQPFIDGWARLECTTFPQFRDRALPQLAWRIENDFAYFREVYKYAFRLNLAEGTRLLPLDTAVAYWQLLLQPRYPAITAKWIDFVSQNPAAVSADTWNMLMEFLEYATKIDLSLENYDETSAWPAIIDDFVDNLRQTSSITS